MPCFKPKVKFQDIQRSKNGNAPIYIGTLETLIRSKMWKNWCLFLRISQLLLKSKKWWYLIQNWWDKSIKGAVVNQTLTSLHAGSSEITLSIPLRPEWYSGTGERVGNDIFRRNLFIPKKWVWFSWLGRGSWRPSRICGGTWRTGPRLVQDYPARQGLPPVLLSSEGERYS